MVGGTGGGGIADIIGKPVKSGRAQALPLLCQPGHDGLWLFAPASTYSGVLSICPFDRTNQCSFANGLPASRSANQSATRIGGNGPRLAAGTLPTECRDSW